MGFAEVARHFFFFLKAARFLKRHMETRRPAVVVCVDYYGFNARVMKDARTCGIPVIWYITPKVWAWKPHRARILGDTASDIAVIFPFETDCFSGYSARVSYVGNPLVEAIGGECENGTARASDGGDIDMSVPRTIGIVPGSREQEIRRNLGVMLDAFSLLRERFPSLRGLCSRYSGLHQELFSACAAADDIEVTTAPLPEMLDRCDVAMVTSGTATLETALRCIPHCIVYKTSWITYTLFKQFVRIPFIGLPNIVAGKRIVDEYIQNEATGEQLGKGIEKLFSVPGEYRRCVQDLRALKSQFGDTRPSKEVAGMIERYV
jgi:lipid-A-disaccharide synthase